MPLYADRVQETTTGTSTGTITLLGAVANYQAFSTAFILASQVVRYTIQGTGSIATEWEVGEGVFTLSGTTLSRVTVLASSNAGALVNFSAGTKLVWCDVPAAAINELQYAGIESHGFRLTLTSGVPVTTSDVTSSTIYFTPFRSGSISLYYHNVWTPYNSAQVSLALGTLVSGKNYDVFAYATSATAFALEILVWTNDTTRATAITTQNGVLVKNGDATRRLVATVRSISTSLVEDSAVRRFVSNLDNYVPRPLIITDTTDNWTYTPSPANTWHQARATASNKVEYVACEARNVTLNVIGAVSTAGTASFVAVGVGVDSTTVNSAIGGGAASSVGSIVTGFYNGTPSTAGYHAMNWLETGNLSQSYTWYGDSGTPILQTGMTGFIDN